MLRVKISIQGLLSTLNKLKREVDISVEVVDIIEDPDLARKYYIITILTLERIKPEPRRRIIDDLSNEEALLKFIGC